MQMITKIAFANAKYHKRKNVLAGIAVILTTMLIFLVLTIGLDMIDAQKAAINELYPSWHGLFRNVPESMIEKLPAHHTVEQYGLRSDLGYIRDDGTECAMMYMDANAMELYKVSLAEGKMPEGENEIVVEKGLLERLSINAGIGDTITFTYQVSTEDGLDFAQKKDFVICGFFKENQEQEEKTSYVLLISDAFLREEIPEEQIKYRFLFQVDTGSANDTELIEAEIRQLAEQFDIAENDIKINTDYLWANYVDPSFVPIMSLIILVVALAGIITIYSIYYISMNERVQELGKIKAIGATRGQLKQMVLREGLLMALIAIPLGLLVGTGLVRVLFMFIPNLYQNVLGDTIKTLIRNGEIELLIPWVYFLAAGVALLTVILSLLHPMKVASKVSEIDAMRYQNETSRKKERKGYREITVGRLAKVYLFGNKKKSMITICSMSITGLLFMVVATVLSCADPVEAANSSILGEYEISPVIEFNNKEHPELEWREVQQNNPLTDELKEEILQIDGIRDVECYYGTYVVSDVFDGTRERILGVPESGKEELEEGIIEGQVSYEELESGDKVIVDKNLLYWYPDIKLGDVIDVTVENGDKVIHRSLEVAAIGEYDLGFSNYNYLIMASDGIQTFSDYSSEMYFHIDAEQKYDEAVEESLKALVAEYGNIQLASWKAYFDEWDASISFVRIGCFTFLGILGAICILNMINMMLNSVYVRKKELGMLQAIGMSDFQLLKMLQLEGLFYTMGTLIIAVGGGSAVGYPVFVWAKDNGMLNICSFHYPMKATILMTIILVLVQLILSFIISKSVKRDSLIDRIRFEN